MNYATYGIEHDGTLITDAPPIAHWAIGKPKKDYIAWCIKKDPYVKFIRLY